MKEYPAIKLSLLFSTGIILGQFFEITFAYLVIFILLIIAAVTFNRKFDSDYLHLLTNFLIAISIIAVATFYYNISKTNFQLLPDNIYKENNVRLIGEVTNIELMKKGEINFYVSANSMKIDTSFFVGGIELLCKIKDNSGQINSIYQKLKIGNTIELTGNFYKGNEERNPGEFDYNNYLRSKGISGIITSYSSSDIQIINADINYFPEAVLSVRKFINDKIEKIYNNESSSLLRGLLLADRSQISYSTKNEFINSGVIHILAVSGLHVGFIVLIFVFLFGRFNIYLRSILTIIGLVLFLIIINAPASAFRASVMAIILILAFLRNRSTNLLNTIAIAALILLVIDPGQLFTPGFQLSFAAVISIAVIYPIISKYLNSLNIRSKLLKNVLLFLGVSLAAQIGTLPITIYYFGKISLVALFTNLIVIPIVGIIVGVGIFSIVLAVFSPAIASTISVVNEIIIKLIFSVIHFAGNLNFSFIRISSFSIADILLFYLFLVLFLSYVIRFRNIYGKLIWSILCLANFILFETFDNHNLLPDNKLSVLMIDVGQGDSFLIKFPNGKTALIDAGEANYFFDNGELVILPLLNYLGIDKIDYGFVSHIDLDHYGGFVSLIHDNKINSIYKPVIDSSEEKDQRFEKYLTENKITPVYYSKKILKIGNARVYILNDHIPENFSSNNSSGILKIVYGKSEFLFTGDLEKMGEKVYLNEYGSFLDSDVLKVGHHGSKTSSSDEFLNIVSPEISLISDGIKNKFHHPSTEVVKRLLDHGSNVYRTDLSGAILLESDGENIKNVNWRDL